MFFQKIKSSKIESSKIEPSKIKSSKIKSSKSQFCLIYVNDSIELFLLQLKLLKRTSTYGIPQYQSHYCQCCVV